MAVVAPIRSRILDFVEPDPQDGPDPACPPDRALEPRRSLLQDFVDVAPPRADGDERPGPKPGVPAYHTPVFVPAHPRSVEATGADGRHARVPFIVFELFEHPTHGTVAFAFTSPQKLEDALGEAQPWAATSIGPLAEGVREQGVTVLLDPRLAPEQHNWTPTDVAAYAREVRR